ncbi:MAG: hypothetical protein IPK75_20135 [Acidobacteria bacterium]|nr:hypothetical protein [Acidobacteriota bacterium]
MRLNFMPVVRAAQVCAVLSLASGVATAAEPDWRCHGTNCFDAASVATDGKGHVAVFAADVKTHESGWIAIDCNEMRAAVPGYETAVQRGSSLDWACSKWGRP